jgi:RNA polymerase sigma factor (sigma-70 family)
LLLGLRGYAVAMFGDAESFLSARKDAWRGCALIDIRMPGMDGLALQRQLRASACDLPVVIMTAHGDVDSARDAFRLQAVDFLEKPIEQSRLYDAIEEAFARQAAVQQSGEQHSDFLRLFSGLTPREKEVMELVVNGRHNREIAQQLDISVRTVEVHKARMMAKLQVVSVPDLVRMSLNLRRP